MSTHAVFLGGFLNSLDLIALTRLKKQLQHLVLCIITATLIIPFEGIAIALLVLVNNVFFNDTGTTEIYPLPLHDALFFFFKEPATPLDSPSFLPCRLSN